MNFAIALLHLIQQTSLVPSHGSSDLQIETFAWADIEGDGQLDLAALENGALRFFRTTKEGGLEDATKSVGLDGIEDANLLLWHDYDGDGRLDLFIGARNGHSRLFRSVGPTSFADWTAASGLSIVGHVISATWLDQDGDARIDLHVVTDSETHLLRSIEGGFLEAVQLPEFIATNDTTKAQARSGHGMFVRSPKSSASISVATSAGLSGAYPVVATPLCATRIRDQANPGGPCLSASSVPTPGLLYPPPHDGGLNNIQSGTHSFVGGGQNNQATNGGGNGCTTVAGGQGNTASGNFATVGGGRMNTASGAHATIAGGQNNAASIAATVGGGNYNDASAIGATVAGGSNNGALGYSSTVGGGQGNLAGGPGARYSTVTGGKGNTASHSYSTVVGGDANSASGVFSFAAGRRAKANHTGAFVWGDSANVDKLSSAVDQFNVYASGGARIFSNAAATTGVVLAAGGGSWSSVSDRASKENNEPVNAREVLERVCSLPISTWNYKDQDDSVRHMGPMAQDFHAAFGLGVSEKMIDTVDPDGVALAAIQGLRELIDEKDAQIDDLRASNLELEARIARLEALEPRRPSVPEPR